MKKKMFLMLFVSLFLSGFVASCGSDENEPIDKPIDKPVDTIPTVKASLKGSNYYLISMGAKTAKSIETKVVKDYRPEVSVLNIWEGTYSAGTPSGPNSYGVVDSWVSLAVAGTAGWSGCGFIVDSGSDLKGITSDYTLHLALRATHSKSLVIRMRDGNDVVVGYTIGATAFNDNGTIYPIQADFKRDGEWQEVEIPMNKFLPQLNYSTLNKKNIIEFLSGGVAGTTLDVDAIFIYKK